MKLKQPALFGAMIVCAFALGVGSSTAFAQAPDGAESAAEAGREKAKAGKDKAGKDKAGEAKLKGRSNAEQKRLNKEQEKHLKRLAKIDRLVEIANQNGNTTLLAKAADARAREEARHAKALEKIASQGGGKDKADKGKDKADKGKDKADKGKDNADKGKDKADKGKDNADKGKDNADKGKGKDKADKGKDNADKGKGKDKGHNSADDDGPGDEDKGKDKSKGKGKGKG